MKLDMDKADTSRRVIEFKDCKVVKWRKAAGLTRLSGLV
jgi:hypothetical protein